MSAQDVSNCTLAVAVHIESLILVVDYSYTVNIPIVTFNMHSINTQLISYFLLLPLYSNEILLKYFNNLSLQYFMICVYVRMNDLLKQILYIHQRC